MRRVIALLAAGCATSGGAPTPGPGAAGAGGGGEDFTLPTLDGHEVSLAEQRGKVVLVPFFATWCLPCATELEQAQRLYQKYRDAGLIVLAVSTDGPSDEGKLPGFVAQHGLTFPVLLDRESRVFVRYQPREVMPFWTLFDRAGRVAKTHEGYAPGDEAEIERAVQEKL